MFMDLEEFYYLWL